MSTAVISAAAITRLFAGRKIGAVVDMSSPWDEYYRNHALWETIGAAREALSEVDIPISDAQSIALQELLAAVDSHREFPDILITQASLDGLEAYLSKLIAELPENLDTIFAGSSSLFEQIAAVVRTWPATGGVKLTGLSSRVDDLNRIFAASEESIVARTSETIVEEREKVATALSELANDVAEYRSQMDARRDLDIEKADEARGTLSETLELLSGEVSAAVETATDLRDRISSQDKRLDEAIGERAEKFAEEAAHRSSEWEAIKAEIYANISESRDVMKKSEEESRNILATTGVNVTAGDYGAYASQQEKVANIWRRAATVAFSLAGAVFVVFAVMPLFSDGLELEWWEYAFQRLGTPVGLAGVAVYMARESGLHRQQQRNAKQAQLTLSALEPFIANLPSKEQSAIRSETARKLFANANTFKAGSEGGGRGRVSTAPGQGSGG